MANLVYSGVANSTATHVYDEAIWFLHSVPIKATNASATLGIPLWSLHFAYLLRQGLIQQYLQVKKSPRLSMPTKIVRPK